MGTFAITSFSTSIEPAYGRNMGRRAHALDMIDARDGFSPHNPETFGPRALDAKKEALKDAKAEIEKALMKEAAKEKAADITRRKAVGLPPDPQTSVFNLERVKNAAPYILAAVVVIVIVMRRKA